MKRKFAVRILMILGLTLSACGTGADTIISASKEASSVSVSAEIENAGGDAETAVSSVSAEQADLSTDSEGREIIFSSESTETTSDISLEENAAGTSIDDADPGDGSNEIDTEGLLAALNRCIGWGGDAGSSLKSAGAATALLDWVSKNTVDTAAEQVITDFYASLDDDSREIFAGNWKQSICPDGELILNADEGMLGTLEDSGNLAAAQQAVSAENTRENWNILTEVIADILGE